jgi:hypothetical protein
MNIARTETTNLTLWAEALNWVKTLPEEIRDLPFDFLTDELPNDQLVAAFAICSGKYDAVTLLGRAGSGKTFVVKACVTILKMMDCEVRVCASTGIAAKNAGGEGTINRFAGLKSGGSTAPVGYRDNVQNHWVRSSVAKRSSEIVGNFDPRIKGDLVIFIDEAGMCSSEMLLLTYQVLSRTLPNRRIRFVATADFRQLLPIHTTEDLPWKSFSSLAFERARFHFAGTPETEIVEFGSLLREGPFDPTHQKPWRSVCLSLIKNRRQGEGSWFANALNHLGDGFDFNHPAVSPLLSRVWLKRGKGAVYSNIRTNAPLPDMTDAIHLYNYNDSVRRHNHSVLEAAKATGAETMVYNAYVEAGLWDKEQILSEVSPLTPTMTLAVGLKFMVRVNIDSHLTNGTVGVIKKLEPRRVLIELPNGEEHWIESQSIPLPFANNSVGEKTPVGKFVQIPGVLCHAMTPWKSQGLTIKEPMVYHLSGWQQIHGLLYVVCSRVTEPDFLYIVVEKGNMLNHAVTCESQVKQFVAYAENSMFKALGQEAVYPEVFSPCDGQVWVRDHLVVEVDYVENPKADVLKDSENCTVYSAGGKIGMYVKNRQVLGQTLLTDDTAFEWFKQHVQFIWFNPAEDMNQMNAA